MEFYQAGRKEGEFRRRHRDGAGAHPGLAEVHLPHRSRARRRSTAGQAYRISDLDLASRLSFFLWSTGPDDELLTVASQGRLKDPAVLEQQVRRMLKDPRAEALAVNFAGQWLNLRGLQSVGPLPLIYPDFDDPLRQAMRREVELLFDSIVREDRSVVDLLTADYTFVNERLAKHYGIPNIYGSQFRRVTLGPDMDVRRGLLGKGAILTTTSKPERTSPVTRGKWVMTNILGMSPPDPPPNVPPLPPRQDDADRQRQRADDAAEDAGPPRARRLHPVPQPDGSDRLLARELRRRSRCGGRSTRARPIDRRRRCSTGRRSTVRRGCASGCSATRDQFVAGRGREAADLRRSAAASNIRTCRWSARSRATPAKNGNRFSALVLGVVKSEPFQMNMKVRTRPRRPRSSGGACSRQDEKKGAN